MTLITNPTYRPAWLHRNAHASTIIPSTFRKVPPLPYTRQRLELVDGDFLDLDWCRGGNSRVVVLCHGLEGDAQRPYVRGMARVFFNTGWDIAAMNFRGCSGEANRLPRSYHSGATEDLNAVLSEVSAAGYEQIVLIGFSLGGNLVLKYLGFEPTAVHDRICAAVTVSVPTDLAGTSVSLLEPVNRIYHARFMRKLKAKISAKAKVMPGIFDAGELKNVRTIIEFDDCYTAPLHGFKDAADYYARNSSQNWLHQIAVPTLLLTASNDPILGRECYPRDAARTSRSFHFEESPWGGHVGFAQSGAVYYSEARALEFVREFTDG